MRKDLSIIRNRQRYFLCIRKVLRTSEVAQVITIKSYVNLQRTSFEYENKSSYPEKAGSVKKVIAIQASLSHELSMMSQ